MLPEPVLRYYISPEQREEQIAELLRTCERLGIREVSLFTADYICGEVFPRKDGLQARLDHLTICAEKIRRAGLVFSLNVMHTLGHLYVPQQDVDRYGFERQVNADGQPGKHPVLDPACPKLRDHLSETFRLYAQLRPRLMFVDDDYGVPLTQCYLPQRLKRFSERFGCHADAKTVQGLLGSSEWATSNLAWNLMTRLVLEDLTALAEALRTAVHAVEPGTRLGIMFSGNVPTETVIGVARALAGTHRPFVRPQIPLYREEAPLAQYPQRFWALETWKSRLPPDFEFYPECECYPYYSSLKSPAAAYAHFASILGAGEPRVALSLNSFATIAPACESRELVDHFAALKGQIHAVVNELAAGGEIQGAGVCVDGGLDLLQLKGVPLRCAAPEDALIQWGGGLNSLSDEAVARLLKRGAILDLRSAMILQDRGLLKLTGLELRERCCLDDLLHIAFPRRDGGTERWAFYYFFSRHAEKEHFPFRFSVAGGQELNHYLNGQRQATAPCMATWTNRDGARFGYINLEMARFGHALLCPWASDALIQMIEGVQGDSLPARIVDPRNSTLKALRLRQPERLLLTVCNMSTSPAPATAIRLAPEFAAWHWLLIDADGQRRPLVGQASTLTLPELLPCLGCAFLLGSRS